MRIDVHHYFHDLLSENLDRKLTQILAIVQNIQQKEIYIMATLDELMQDVTDEGTVEDGLVTLTEGIKAQLDAFLAGQLTPEVQAKVDAVFAGVEANKAKVSAAITANTPAAPAP